MARIAALDTKDLPEGHWRHQDRERFPAVADPEKLIFELVNFAPNQLAVYVREFAGANADSIVFLHTVALVGRGSLTRVFEEYVVEPRMHRLTFPGNGTAVWRETGTVSRLNAEGTALSESGPADKRGTPGGAESH